MFLTDHIIDLLNLLRLIMRILYSTRPDRFVFTRLVEDHELFASLLRIKINSNESQTSGPIRTQRYQLTCLWVLNTEAYD